jgi:hypothetical protein
MPQPHAAPCQFDAEVSRAEIFSSALAKLFMPLAGFANKQG